MRVKDEEHPKSLMSHNAEEEIAEELEKTSEIRSLAIKESTQLFLRLERLFSTGS